MSGDQAQLSWSEDGRPRSTRFDDIYYAADGLAESRAVFLRGCGLPDAWAGRRRFTVGELGFGTGLNILALLQLWREAREPGGYLHIFSVEAHPLQAGDADRALTAFPEIAELAQPLLARWPGRTRGMERVEWPELGAVLDVATAEVAEGLGGWSGQADAWFLDGFAPSRNPEMWRPEVLDLVRARSAPGARLGTFTVAGTVRRGLAERGFRVERAPGHGGKLERLEARLNDAPLAPAPPARVIVVGAGIAGAALARAFDRLGVSCTVVDAQPGGGASGNPAALVSPRLDVGGGPAARLYAQAFARAVDLYRKEAPEAVVSVGAMRLPGGPKDEVRFAQLAASDLFPEGGLEHLGPDEAEARLGGPAPASLWMRDALTVEPRPLLDRWLAGADACSAAVATIHREGELWRVLDADGKVLAEAEALCLAAGADAERWLPESLLEPVRGQASWSDQVPLPGAAASWGGYAVPLPAGGLLFGATHARGSTDRDATVDDDRRNLATLAEPLPELAKAAAAGPLQSRASLRAATSDRLPLAGAVPDRPALWVLGGLGGRGFTTAPLLAEHVAALAVGAPSPLPRDLAEAVDPGRFQARVQRRSASRTPDQSESPTGGSMPRRLSAAPATLSLGEAAGRGKPFSYKAAGPAAGIARPGRCEVR